MAGYFPVKAIICESLNEGGIKLLQLQSRRKVLLFTARKWLDI